MRAQMTFTEPEKIRATLQITMTLEEWEDLKNQLVDEHPSWKLSSAISDVLSPTRHVAFTDTRDAE
ncbi:hypothetical protein [Aurantimonas coralicida]|uniref:hypothetical protein n=1 Tax=Aurantimonas coralicida TaxID=182270 RepID=UPI001E488208|nr:hypothetical protein [Aurantimonas coralicida]MCD1645190.1 hypothetical protein [Aurantimonas coralicida]